MKEFIDKGAFLEKMKRTPRYFDVKFDIEEMPTATEAEIRNKAITEFAEKLKEKAEKILKNPDIMLDCKKCTIWKVRDIDEIAEQMKGEKE